jgi:hypothetical protein
MSTNVERLSYQRDLVYDYCCDRFKELIAEDRHEDALAIADEFYEWLDPNQMEEEDTLYYNEEDLLELYSKLTCD